LSPQFADAYTLMDPDCRSWLSAQRGLGTPPGLRSDPRVREFLRDVIGELPYGVRVAAKRELTRRLHNKEPLGDGVRDCGVGGAVTLYCVWRIEVANRVATGLARADLDACRFGRRVNVDDASVRGEKAAGTNKGIDHALSRHSSQRPR